MPTRKLLFLDLPIEVNMGAVAWVPGFHLWQSFFVFVNEECLIQIHRLHGCQQQIVKTIWKSNVCFMLLHPSPPFADWELEYTATLFISIWIDPMLQWNNGIGWKPENLDQDRPDPKTLKTPESCKTEQKTEQKTLQHISKSEFAEFYYVLFYTCISIYLNWICETSRELAAQIWFQQRVSTLVRNFAHNQMSVCPI